MTELRKTLLLVLLSLALVLAACGPEADGDESEPAADAGELVVYSGRSETLVQPIIDRFAEATGIDVRVKYGGTAELAATLLEEGDASPADVFYAQDPGGLGAVEEAGLLAALPADLIERVPERFASADSLWVGISGRARVVVYNTEQVTTAELPAELTGFTDPVWEGRIGWAPTNGSFQAMVTAMRALWGDEATRSWLEAIQANDPVVYEGNTPIVAAVGAGEVDVGFVNHYYLYRFLAEEGSEFPARNHFLPGGGPGSLIMVSGAGVLESAANSDNAQRFLEFLLSDEAQTYFTTETFEYPVIEGVETAADLPPLAELDQAAADVDLTQLADLEGTVLMLSEVGALP